MIKGNLQVNFVYKKEHENKKNLKKTIDFAI